MMTKHKILKTFSLLNLAKLLLLLFSIHAPKWNSRKKEKQLNNKIYPMN